LISFESWAASFGVYVPVITALPVNIASFTTGAVNNSPPTNIAIGCHFNLVVSSQKISAHSVLKVNSTIG